MNLIVQKTQIKRYGWFRILPVIGVLVFILCWQAGFALSQEWATSGTYIYNTNSGNVGIGTPSPGQKLEVIGGSRFNSGSEFSAIDAGWSSSSGYSTDNFGIRLGAISGAGVVQAAQGTTAFPLSLQLYGGNVGIGTSSPDSVLTIMNDNNSVYTGHFKNSNGSAPTLWVEAMGNDNNNIGVFKVDVNGSTRFMVSNYNGNVGIGTTNPSAKLDVLGDAIFSGTVTGGNIQAKYQDIAEWVYSPMSVASGTVVVLDVQDINRVIPSSLSYDTRVAGVVTDTPGILLGESGNGKVKVATTGRVKVKADATYRPINIGDLLVTSDKEGYAMRSEPVDLGGIPIHRPGTLIGKALQPLKDGQGEILVLLSLQ